MPPVVGTCIASIVGVTFGLRLDRDRDQRNAISRSGHHIEDPCGERSGVRASYWLLEGVTASGSMTALLSPTHLFKSTVHRWHIPHHRTHLLLAAVALKKSPVPRL
ncbi:hypothetical protein QBC40DRAFT_279128 [Triangularia verruculosa]|uniref:Uncharacterized protein n=1 Tax=Triangularia verruculosa TaxID=2587418 RepID=A0AAN6XKK9_9PEZI|nr:hypothetical protein QBC40DRAFT_279128 [Triangularia verruculosa]